MVGQISTPPSTGFVYDVGSKTFADVDYPGGADTRPAAINANSIITGNTTIAGSTVGVELSGSQYRQVQPPGAVLTEPSGISGAGKIVGSFNDSTGNGLSFSYSGGRYRRLHIPGAPNGSVNGISPAGDAIVGWYLPDPVDRAGFIYRNGVLQTLQYPGATFTEALAINNNGVVVGHWMDSSNQSHGMLWVPTTLSPTGRSR